MKSYEKESFCIFCFSVFVEFGFRFYVLCFCFSRTFFEFCFFKGIRFHLFLAPTEIEMVVSAPLFCYDWRPFLPSWPVACAGALARGACWGQKAVLNARHNK